MGQLEAALDSLRPAAAAKPKFSFFKRKADASASAPVPVPASAAPSTEAEGKVVTATKFRSLSNRSSARLMWTDVPPSQSGQHDLTIADLDHCFVDLLPRDGKEENLTALHIRDVRDSVLLLPEVAGSILLLNMYRCVLVVGCHQVNLMLASEAVTLIRAQYRMHSSKNVRVFLNVSSNPVVEHCSAIAFGAYPASLLGPTVPDRPASTVSGSGLFC